MKKAAALAKSPPKPKPSGEPKKSPESSDETPRRPRPSRTKASEPAAPATPSADRAASVTIVAARCDIGFGNAMFLRGTGPGLSWEVGTPMDCTADDLWTLEIVGAPAPVSCKFLINDQDWSSGPDFVVYPGAQLEVTPHF